MKVREGQVVSALGGEYGVKVTKRLEKNKIVSRDVPVRQQYDALAKHRSKRVDSGQRRAGRGGGQHGDHR